MLASRWPGRARRRLRAAAAGARAHRPAARGVTLPRRRDRGAPALAGDPAGYRARRSGARSFFEGSGLDPRALPRRGLRPGPTVAHHPGGRNAYLLSETVLSRRSGREPAEAQDPQEDRRHACAEEPGRNQRRQELAAHHCVGRRPAATSSRASAGSTACAAAPPSSRALLARGLGTRCSAACGGSRWPRAATTSSAAETGTATGPPGACVCDLNRCLYYSDARGAHPTRRRRCAPCSPCSTASWPARARARWRRATCRWASCLPRPIPSRSISPRCA